MPKINVYLPDDLATAVRDARIPVSAVCQRALEEALQRATAAAESARALEAAAEEDLPVGSRATPRLRTAVKNAYAAAREQRVNYVGTEHLLLGLLGEGENLAVRVIEVLDVEPDDVRRELDALIAQQQGDAPRTGEAPRMTPLAARVFQLATQEALRLGHNYIGCEHLLLGLVEEDEGLGGRALRSMGVDKTVARRAVISTLSGYVQARRELSKPPPPAADPQLREILDRLAAIEHKLES
jgi:ATP-dependent Clp protease ATP-binding subunit ClpA/post-segregation antitoxin (ccd killing protein)